MTTLAERVARIVCDDCGVDDLHTRTRKDAMLARRSIAWILVRCAGMSMAEVAPLCGYRNHTSVLCAVRGVDEHGPWRKACEEIWRRVDAERKKPNVRKELADVGASSGGVNS